MLTLKTGCYTCYYHDYYVHDQASKVTYYLEQPQYVHGTATTFIDKESCRLFTNMMLHAWWVYLIPCQVLH